MQVFLPDGTDPDTLAVTSTLIDDNLPATFHGWPTRYGWDAVAVGTHVIVTTLDVGSSSSWASTPAHS